MPRWYKTTDRSKTDAEGSPDNKMQEWKLGQSGDAPTVTMEVNNEGNYEITSSELGRTHTVSTQDDAFDTAQEMKKEVKNSSSTSSKSKSKEKVTDEDIKIHKSELAESKNYVNSVSDNYYIVVGGPSRKAVESDRAKELADKEAWENGWAHNGEVDSGFPSEKSDWESGPQWTKVFRYYDKKLV